MRELERRMLANLPPRDLAAHDFTSTNSTADFFPEHSSSSSSSYGSSSSSGSSNGGTGGGGVGSALEGEGALQRLWWRHAPPGLEPAPCATPTDAALYARWASSATLGLHGAGAAPFHTTHAGANDVVYHGGAGQPWNNQSAGGGSGRYYNNNSNSRPYAQVAASALVLPEKEEPAWLKAARKTQASAAQALKQASIFSGNASTGDGSSLSGGGGDSGASGGEASRVGESNGQDLRAPPATPLTSGGGGGDTTSSTSRVGPPVAGVPPFLQGLMRSLPPAAPGQRPDVDLVLSILLHSPQLGPGGSGLGPGIGHTSGYGKSSSGSGDVGNPSVSMSAPPGMVLPPGMGPPPGMGKRARGGPGGDDDDSDDDDAAWGGSTTNVFRQRQKSRLA